MSATTDSSMMVHREIGVQSKRRVTGFLLVFFFIFLSVIFLFPLYWMVVSSLRPQGMIFAEALDIFPSVVTLDSYHRLFAEQPYGRWILNSITQTAGYATVALIICTMGGYALAKYRFPFRNLLFILILVSQMIPFHLLIVSLFLMIIQLGMVESYLGAILPVQINRQAVTQAAIDDKHRLCIRRFII